MEGLFLNQPKYTIDDAPFNKFHLRITGLTFGSSFCDGYALGIIAVALTVFGPQMELNAMWTGLIGSSALIGLFAGSLVLGRLSDRIGRQRIFLVNFLLITIATILQFFVSGPAELFVLRLLIGFGLGGDYAVGSTLLAEFSPKKYRASLLASLNGVWTLGYVASNFVGYYLAQTGPDSWRWMLVSAAIPSIVVLILRIGTPESPRWLVSMGRVEEARQIVKKHIGPNVEMGEMITDSQTILGFRGLFSKRLRKRMAFGGIFKLTLVIPYFTIYTFLPSILRTMGFEQNFFADMMLNLFLLVGAIAGLWFLKKFSRRGFTIGSFAILAVSLFTLSIMQNGSQFLMLTAFLVFTFIMSAASNLTLVYPAELFPTELRGSGVGMVTAISRIGAAIGTFLLPVSINSFGLSTSMIGMSVILLIGMIVSIAWAPETKSLSLNEASNPLEEASNSLQETSNPLQEASNLLQEASNSLQESRK
ncbi:MFS transporter [Bacillus cereus]|uniref:MFS transporter n=1 Tax=Bacillus cereus TaxID=1396 RepID=A0AA44Q6F4_BACCE|nr:MFS transporter [Bacillus cereus]PFM99749.1 MFS transporter [Bacillus cereus]PFR89990.1 MFS transporter [Bacillus cereus]